MIGSLDDKAVIVTGASSGIGRAIAIELGKVGAELWLVGRNQAELDATAQMICDAGGPGAHTAPMDLRERGPLAALVEKVAGQHPHLFALINNAGVMYPEPILSGSVDRWQAMLDINVMAMLEGCKAAVEAMRIHARPGHLINVGSVQARFEVPGVYGISKQAVEAIGVSLREELEQDDIRVCTIIPGGFETQLARGFRQEELARVASSFESRGVAFGGDGAHRLVSDPQHIANIVRYVLEQPIDINFQEILIRPPVSTKAS
ncbi:SDR family oxidoreductase [Sphingobium lactosutens]|uniref:SDR family oxidoreductase n=1 Tax=Sphingobium lactosutens TaxID=522773 RepID=UPI0015B964DB|nr:SDR family oxidoreductase [Sphingobium lactosutens]